MNDTSTMPFSTATPDSAMKPTPAEIDSGMSRSHSASTPPVSASGTPLKINRESVSERNARVSSTKIKSSVTGTTSRKRSAPEISCSNVPPYSSQ